MAGTWMNENEEEGVYAVADLPTTLPKMTRAWVNDAAATPTYRGTATGGGSILAPVWWNGSAWLY
jgi:hypothetical protein